MRNYLPSKPLAFFSVFAIDVDQTPDQYDDCTYQHLHQSMNNVLKLEPNLQKIATAIRCMSTSPRARRKAID
jgi:hypothetical protein